MAVISRNHNLLFIMTPRTASTAVAQFMCHELSGKYIPDQDILDNDGFFKVQKKHSTLTELFDNQLLSYAEFQSLFKFTIVRNPFDNLVSLYHKKRYKYRPLIADPESWIYRIPNYVDDIEYCQSHTFNSWIRKHLWRSSLKRILNGKPSMYRRYAHGVDAVLRFENLQTELQGFLQGVGIELNLSLPKVNRTEERVADFCTYYNPLSRLIVQFAFHYDLKRFDYEFSTPE